MIIQGRIKKSNEYVNCIVHDFNEFVQAPSDSDVWVEVPTEEENSDGEIEVGFAPTCMKKEDIVWSCTL